MQITQAARFGIEPPGGHSSYLVEVSPDFSGGSAASGFSLMACLKSLIALPRPDPSSGSFFGPKTNNAMTAIIMSSGTPSCPIYLTTFLRKRTNLKTKRLKVLGRRAAFVDDGEKLRRRIR